MQRRNRFWLGFLAAAITFGTLTAFLGPRYQHYGGFRHHHHRCCDDGDARMNDKCDHYDSRQEQNAPEQPKSGGDSGQ